MRITYSDFKPLRATTRATDALTYRRTFAVVKETITTGWWRWKRTTTRQIMVYRDQGGAYWRHMNSGQFTHGDQVEALSSAFEARLQLETLHAAHQIT